MTFKKGDEVKTPKGKAIVQQVGDLVNVLPVNELVSNNPQHEYYKPEDLQLWAQPVNNAEPAQPKQPQTPKKSKKQGK